MRPSPDYTSLDEALHQLQELGYTHLVFAGMIPHSAVFQPFEGQYTDMVMFEVIPVREPAPELQRGWECHPLRSEETDELASHGYKWYHVKTTYLQ